MGKILWKDGRKKSRFTGAITLPLMQNGDPEITCIMCNIRNCEYGIELWGNGIHLWAGLHARCLEQWRNVAPMEQPEGLGRSSCTCNSTHNR